MAANSKIEWCDHTQNFWLGCDPVHIGCANCFAQAYFKRMGIVGKRKRTAHANWRKPLAWNRQTTCTCGLAGYSPGETTSCPGGCIRSRVFCGSLMDLFEDWQGPIVDAKGKRLSLHKADTSPPHNYLPGRDDVIPPLPARWATMADLRGDAFAVIDQCQNLDWLVLTKRPENIWRFWAPTPMSRFASMVAGRRPDEGKQRRGNVHLLYSASDQESLEAGIDDLLECRDLVPVLGLSLEPLLGPIDIEAACRPCRECNHPGDVLEWPCPYCKGGFEWPDWVIVGGESGPNARPCQIEWILDIIEQCKAAGVPCFVKQWGANAWSHSRETLNIDCRFTAICNYMEGPSGHVNIGQWGALWPLKHPKGGDPEEWPEELRVRQVPGGR